MPTTENAAIVREIQSQILHIEIQLKKQTFVSEQVRLLVEKKALQDLLTTYRS